MSPASAIERTELCTIATMSAAARAGNLEYVVLRSGLEVYGPRTARGVGARRRRDARAAHAVRAVAARGRVGRRRACGCRHGVSVCALRYAPVVGPHVPSPVGRLLRLPVVPVPAFADPPFSLLHPDDAAEAMVAAIDRRYDGAAQRRRPRCGDALAGGAARRPRAAPGRRPVVGRRVTHRGARGCGDRAARDRAAAPRSHRRGQPRDRKRSASLAARRRKRCCASSSSGPTSSRSRRAGRRWREPARSEPTISVFARRPDRDRPRRRSRCRSPTRCAGGSMAGIPSTRSVSTRNSSTS